MNKRIRILSTSDVHGVIYPYAYADMKERDHGFARLSTLINELRDENTLLIDNGDTIEGSSFTFYHYSRKRDEICPVSSIMRSIGYDYLNVGNHDFNYGEEALFRHVKESGSKWLTANVLYKGELLGPEYVIHEFCNKKMAVFALTSHFVPHWEDKENIRNFTFLNAYETAEKIVRKIKEEEDPDYIVCVYHGGFERDPETGEPSEDDTGENQGYRILENIKGIDVILMGHQHRTCVGKLFGTAYTQPFQNGIYLSCVDIDTETGEITPELLEVKADPDEKVMAIAAAEEKEVQSWLDTPLGHTDIDMRILDDIDVRLNKSQLATFINIVQKEVSGADLSGAALFLNACGFTGDITMRTLVNTYFFPNTLFVKKINGKILKEYLERNADFWTVKDDQVIVNPLYDFPTPAYHNYDMVDGIEYTIKASNPNGSKIIELTRNGKPIGDEEEFTIAINSYRAAGSGGFEMISDSPTVKEIQKSVSEILAEYIEEKKEIAFEPVNNIKVIV